MSLHDGSPTSGEASKTQPWYSRTRTGSCQTPRSEGWGWAMIQPSTIPAQLAQEGVHYAPQIASAARRYSLDPKLLAAVAAQETGGPGSNAGSNIVGDGGHGHGLFQIDDRWHSFAKSPEAMDPGANADYAAGMLSGLLKRYGGNVTEALSAYNAGSPHAQGTTTRWSDGQMLSYAASVLRHYRGLGGSQPNASSSSPDESSLEACIAERSMDASSIAPLSAQAMLLPIVPPLLPSSNPGVGSPRSAQSLDATGHPRSGGTTDADLIADDDRDADTTQTA